MRSTLFAILSVFSVAGAGCNAVAPDATVSNSDEAATYEAPGLPRIPGKPFTAPGVQRPIPRQLCEGTIVDETKNLDGRHAVVHTADSTGIEYGDGECGKGQFSALFTRTVESAEDKASYRINVTTEDTLSRIECENTELTAEVALYQQVDEATRPAWTVLRANQMKGAWVPATFSDKNLQLAHCQIGLELDAPTVSYAHGVVGTNSPAVRVSAKAITTLRFDAIQPYRRDLKISVVEHRVGDKLTIERRQQQQRSTAIDPVGELRFDGLAPAQPSVDATWDESRLIPKNGAPSLTEGERIPFPHNQPRLEESGGMVEPNPVLETN